MIDGFSGFDGLNGRQLKLSTPNEAFLAAGEGYPTAVEGEGSPSEEQSDDLMGQSGRDGVEFGLEIDGGGVDAAVAIDRGEDGRAALVSGQCGVLDIEELRADF